MTYDRRAFLQISTSAMLAAASNRFSSAESAPAFSGTNESVLVKGAGYSWEYTQTDDTFRLRDARSRLMVSGKLQPLVVVAPADEPNKRQCQPGKAMGHRMEPGRVIFDYEGVNGTGRLSSAWRFDEHGIWTEPITYESSAKEDVVSLHYFAQQSGDKRTPMLHSSYQVVPGLLSGSAISPIVEDYVHLDESVWLGRGSFIPGLSQQWGLPVHYFSGFSIHQEDGQRNQYTEGRSDAFACGLADLPGGDLFLQLYEGKSSLWIDYRSDLWKHYRGPGRLTLGATLFWAVAPDYYQAVAGYYRGLLDAGVIHRHRNSEHKTAVCLTPQFCTWGVQIDRNHGGERLDLRDSGMKAGLFSIDDKWEGTYGKLEHSAERLPHFEQFLDRLRADGFKIGMWAALMRCERPSDLGLSADQMLKLPDGKPYMADFAGSRYYILDFTQPAVAGVLGDLARKFMRRYKPDLLKFDFGYELPAVGIAAPLDKNWTGERLMLKGLEVVIKAMREENPDLVVMYYNLSPLFLDYFDLHSPDDLYMTAGEYELEANRRIYFSSLLGPLGIPTYGSSGYDWASAPSIWFDSAAVGTLGSLNDFQGDEQGESASAQLIARYNGLTHAVRPTDTFEILPLGTVSEAPTLGAHARSWARFEGGQLVLLASRPPVAGEEYSLSSIRQVDSRVKDVLHAAAPVVVASKTSQSILSSDRLAIVPYGGGEIALRRQSGKTAQILSHYFGGAVERGETSIEAGQLKLNAQMRNQEGKPLEWIEVKIS
jgi:hypothetical protein